ncbi:hypothetical protein FD16_GL001445 [Paucilactobacillus suebicus DSM 5007 = KCTC 3549]|uniref:Uncharacterized protein n=2 Tax=Paucilactobacillus suebicus TaxID=152335 RepID=A0A0R1VWU2_9LACO|nr:hypothetical protein FD16_GL001445 [Paucilactobacillus suebicus DSM 5007 = KCTC 3549]
MTGGKESSIKSGDFFDIIDDKPVIISNPKTGEEITRYNRFKYKMRVTDVYDGYSKLTASSLTGTSSLINKSIAAGLDKKHLNIANNTKVQDVHSRYSYNAISVGDELVKDNS